MVDTAGDLIEGLRDMRIRQAILVTALVKLGGSLDLTHEDAYAAAAFDIEVHRVPGKLQVSLKAAPK